MSPYDQLRAHLSRTVPFAAHAGVEIVELSSGRAVAELMEREFTRNHVGTQHAGALYTVAEAASGAAMAGMFLPRLATVRPVAASSEIAFLKPARGTVRAEARVDADEAALNATLETEGRIRFPVSVEITDTEGNVAARMTVDWHLTSLSPNS